MEWFETFKDWFLKEVYKLCNLQNQNRNYEQGNHQEFRNIGTCYFKQCFRPNRHRGLSAYHRPGNCE